jgi:hypothetical protein
VYNIKKTSIFILLSAILAFVGCTKDDNNSNGGSNNDVITGAHITDSTYYSDKHFTAYNFVYPSKDPYGNNVMLTGTITFGDAVKKSAYAEGLLLYNHYTIYRADQCPSKGYLSD